MADETTGREPATETADLYHRHGEPDASAWQEAAAVTDRPNDLEGEVRNTTMAERAAARKKASAKEVKAESTEDKAVTSAATKARRSTKK